MLSTYTNATISPSFVDYSKVEIAGSVYDNDGKVIAAARRHTNGIWHYLDPDIWQHGPPAREINSGIYLGHLFSHFGHFLIETLPQLAFCDDTSEPLLFHGFPHSLTYNAIRESDFASFIFDCLDINLNRVHLVTDTTSVRSLAVAPRSLLVRGILPWSIAPLIQKILLGIEEADGYEKIYLTRTNFEADSRRFLGEPHLEEMFSDLGFVIIAPEQLPLRKQLSIIRSCKVMAGLDGSAMHLSLFMKAGGHSLIINTRNRQKAFSAINDLAAVTTHWIDLPSGASNEKIDLKPQVNAVLRQI